MPHSEGREYAPGGTVRILCVAKLTEERKNHFLLVRALEPLAADFDFEVTFVGGSTQHIKNSRLDVLEALQDYATNGPMAPRVSIRKDVAFVEMNEIYRNHDICVLPSRAEPLGTAPLEAMAQGCAAIISSDSGSAYYVQSSIEAGRPCGAIFATNDPTALRDVLANLISDMDELRKYGHNAVKWTRSEFSPSLFSERAKKVFNRPH
jgi:glycosyltransferase involved in cell wall biosynthesis